MGQGMVGAYQSAADGAGPRHPVRLLLRALPAEAVGDTLSGPLGDGALRSAGARAADHAIPVRAAFAIDSSLTEKTFGLTPTDLDVALRAVSRDSKSLLAQQRSSDDQGRAGYGSALPDPWRRRSPPRRVRFEVAVAMRGRRITKVVVPSAECASSVPPCESTIWWAM